MEIRKDKKARARRLKATDVTLENANVDILYTRAKVWEKDFIIGVR